VNLSASIQESGTARLTGKSAAAFRTIAEVSDDLDLPAHVLRFWESKFPQIKPLKRRGGRRYYRPEDVALLRRIRSLLYTEGYTIKGVQRLLREPGGRSEMPGASTPAERDAEYGERTDAASAERPAPSPVREIAAADADELRAVLAELEALRALLRDRGY
jgi:DNA-binding transcriptional MerR regulator